MNPYDDELAAVWRDPMEYDMQTHGPSYLPVTAAQRVEVREFAQKRAAFYDVVDTRPGAGYYPLSGLLALLRAAYMLHQTAHWQTHGGHFYGDHIMLQRIYDESLEGIDGVAERLVGLSNSPGAVCPVKQAKLIHSLVTAFATESHSYGPEALIQRSLTVESVILKVITLTKEAIEGQGQLTDGLEDLLQGLASKHEEFVYLLQQRSSTRTASSYDRR